MNMPQTKADPNDPTFARETVVRMPARGAQPTPSLTELRLRAVVESAPVSLVVVNPECEVLAANQATLALLGVEQLDDVRGQDLGRLVAPEHRQAVTDFVGRVCRGESGSLEYELVGAGDTRRTVETRAVPLQREGITPAAFLGATWDVSERKLPVTAGHEIRAELELLRAQQDASEEALRDAKRAYEELQESRTQTRNVLVEAEQQREQLASQLTAAYEGLETTVRDYQDRLRASEAQAAEREDLLSKLGAAEEQRAEAVAQLHGEQRAREAAVEQMAQEHKTTVAALTDRTHQLEESLCDIQARHDEALTKARAESEALTSAIAHLERRGADLTEAWKAQRDALENNLFAEREHSSALLAERDHWRARLAEVLGALKETSARAERVLHEDQKARRLSDEQPTVVPVRLSPPPTVSEESESGQWGF